MHWFIHGLFHSCIDSFVLCVIEALIQSLIQSCIDLFMHLIHSFVDYLMHWFIHALIRSCIDSFMPQFILALCDTLARVIECDNWFIHALIHSWFIHALIHSCTDSFTRYFILLFDISPVHHFISCVRVKLRCRREDTHRRHFVFKFTILSEKNKLYYSLLGSCICMRSQISLPHCLTVQSWSNTADYRLKKYN